jgi:hypothetical protein
VVVKRSAEERKKLPPELEAFARSQDEKLRVPRPRSDQGRVRDPREGFTIAGVANRDARAVYDARSEAMRALWAEGQAGEAELLELGGLLHDALRLMLWRARRVTDFEAFAEEVIGIPAARARALVEAHTQRVGEPAEALNERTVAAWLRTEAGLFEGDERARVRLRDAAAAERGPAARELVICVSLAGVSRALAGAGARHAPLAREQNEALARSSSGHGGAAAGKPGVRLLTRRAPAPGLGAPLAGRADDTDTAVHEPAASRAAPDDDAGASTHEPAPSRAAHADDAGASTHEPAPSRAAYADDAGATEQEPAPPPADDAGALEQEPAPPRADHAVEENEHGFADGAADPQRGPREKRGFGGERGFAEGRDAAGGGQRGFGKRSFAEGRDAAGGQRGFGKRGFAEGRDAAGGGQRGFGKRGFAEGRDAAGGGQRGFTEGGGYAPRGEARGFGNKRGFDKRGAEGRSASGAPRGEARGFGGKRGFDKRGAEGRSASGAQRGFGGKPGFDKRGAEGRSASGAQRGFGGKRGADERGFGAKRAFGDKRGFGARPGAERAGNARGSERPRSFGAERNDAESRGFGEKRPFAGRKFAAGAGFERPERADKRGGDKRGGGFEPAQKRRFDKRGPGAGKGAGKRVDNSGHDRDAARGSQRKPGRSEDAGDE